MLRRSRHVAELFIAVYLLFSRSHSLIISFSLPLFLPRSATDGARKYIYKSIFQLCRWATTSREHIFSHASSAPFTLAPPSPRALYCPPPTCLAASACRFCPVSSWGSFGIGCDSHLHFFASCFHGCASLAGFNLYLRTCICVFVAASALVLALLICHCLARQCSARIPLKSQRFFSRIHCEKTGMKQMINVLEYL